MADYGLRSEKKPRSVFSNFQAETSKETQIKKTVSPPPRAPDSKFISLQSEIDRAMARSFIYRLLAAAFEYPSEQNWQWLSRSETKGNFLEALKNVSSSEAKGLFVSGNNLSSRFVEVEFETFKSEYIGAFGHAARGACPLNEIEYGELKADPLFQPHRLADLGAFYRAFGLNVTTDACERHDHISLELEFMCVLAAKEAYALENQLEEELMSLCCDARKKFLREHLGRWTPAFARRAVRNIGVECTLGLLADFTRTFVEADCRRFGVEPGSEDLLLRPIDETAESLCGSCGIGQLPPGALAT